MSHYSEVKTQIKDTQHLVTALVQMGIKKEHIKVDEKGMTCKGYGNQRRRAHVKVASGAGISRYSAETGWERQADGTMTCYSDAVDKQWMDRLESEYTRAVTLEQARRSGWFVQENSWNQDKTELTVRVTQ
tara:strand:- start:10429 stop:10821 length:393 start_codon:yes stop_codon:yes gene_type:complete